MSNEELVALWSKTGDQDFDQVEQYGRALIAECVRRLREQHDPKRTAMITYSEAADWLEGTLLTDRPQAAERMSE